MNNNKTRLDERSTKQIFYANETNFFKTNFNGSTTSSDGTQAVFDAGDRINFMVNFDEFHKYSQIKSIKMRVKSTSSSTTFTLNQEQSLYTKIDTSTEYYSADGNGYCEIEIINNCSKEQSYLNYLSLAFRSSTIIYTTSTSTTAYRPQLIVEYIDDKESIVNQKMIEGTAGRALNYQVNVRTGRPTYTKSLLNINTTVMPINLGLYYDPLLAETIDYNMPKGWRFTYDLSLTSTSEGYEYRDGNGLRHQFVKSLNNSNVYYDIAGTGLILTKTSNSYIIEDGYNNFITFDLWNHVTKVSKKIYDSNNVLNEFGLTFTYTTGTDLLETIIEQNTISGVTTTDEKVTINYSSSAGGIEITSTGFPSIVIKKDSSNYLTQIVEEDNRTNTYGYTSSGLLATAQTDNGEKVVFTYDTRNRISTITDCVTNDANILNKHIFEYGYLVTKVTNYFNVITVYSFNGEGELVGQYEVANNEYHNIRMIDKTDEYTKINIANAESYLGYDDITLTGNVEQIVTTIKTPNTSLGKGTLSLNTTDTFIVSFIYSFDEAFRNNENSYISIIQNDNEIKRLELSQYRVSETIGSLTFKCNSTSELRVKVAHNYNQGTMTVKNIRISQANMLENYVVTNEVMDEDDNTVYSIDGDLFYNYDNEAFYYGSSSILLNKKIHYVDLIENKKNIKLNSSSYHLWYNKKRGLVANTTNVLLVSDVGNIPLNNLIVGTITVNNGYTSVNYSDYSIADYLRVEHSVIKKSSNELTLEEKKINKNFQVIESVDSNDITKQNTFDDYGNVLTTKVLGNDSKYILKEYTYNKMLLLTEKTYINGVASIVTYTRNANTGNVEKVTYPDGLVVDYTYYDSTNGKLNKLSTTVDSVVNSNTLSYNKDKPSNYKGMNSGHSLSYDKYNMPYRHNNGSNYIWTINRDISESGMVTITSFDTTGSFYIRETYDRFGNLILRQESSNGTSYQTVLTMFYSDYAASNISTTNNPNNDSGLKKNSKSKLRKVVDSITGDTVSYGFDNLGKDSSETHTNTTYNPSSINLSYDSNDRVSAEIIHTSDSTIANRPMYKNTFTEELEGMSTNVYNDTIDTYVEVRYVKDSLGRIITEDMIRDDESLFRKVYTYMDSGNNCSNLIRSITFKVGSDEDSLTTVDVLTYSYDLMGRITTIKNNSNVIINQYYYDKLGRLIRENNRTLNKTLLMAYDLNGNILSKKETTFTLGNSTISSYTTITYEVPTTSSASDILAKYNGQTLTTTNPGNITAIGSVTYSWTRQHFLSQVYKSAYDYSTYSYAGNGVRTKKIHYQNGTAVTHTYVTSKGRILKETITGGAYAGVINYLYLGNSVIGFTYNDSKYIFKKNLQNDIIGIYDEGDNLVASYVYDAWGNHKVYGSNGVENTSTTFIGNINPFRYRSYYYDRESKLYYCKARYYNPELCRWMSLDSIEYLEEDRINGCNLYAYCGNDPVNNIDPSGHAWYHWVIGAVVAAAIIVLSVYTAGAILTAAPAIASYASTMAIAYTGSLVLGSAAATAVSVGAATLAIGTIAVGVNEGVSALSGYNAGRELMGDEAYNAVASIVTIGGAAYITGGMSLPYPSTCHSPDYTSPKDLKDQMVLNTAKSQPLLGVSSGKQLGDPRFPSWLGWEKYYYSSAGVQVHYVGNRFFPSWYPYAPWFDYKIKYHK